jgi:N-acetylglucosaminyl-diphospho-decaprenol L-rhamnosyltransferase
MDVHISVVDHGHPEQAARCLATLAAACQGLEWRATAVENLSGSDTTPVRRGFPDVELRVNPRPLGFGANHNAVLRASVESGAARYVLVLNDDTELDRGAVTALVRFADAHPQLGAVGPAVRTGDGAPENTLLPFPTLLSQLRAALARPPRHAAPAGRGWLNGACLLLRVGALRRVGLFDERFFMFREDTDLGRRLLRAGLGSAVCAEAGMVHHGHATVAQPSFGSAMERQMVRSQWLYDRRWHGRAYAAAALAATRAARALRAAKAAATGQPRLAGLLWELARFDPARPLPHEEL